MHSKEGLVTVVVTGASGYIGSAFVRHLQRQGGYFLRLVTHSTSINTLAGNDITNHVVQDFCNVDHWAGVLQGADIVVHFAGLAHVLDGASKHRYFLTNVHATTVLGELAARHGILRFVYMSSIGVNGNRTRENIPFVESDPVQPHNDYTRSKSDSEQILMNLAQKTKMDVVIVRAPLVYGSKAPGNFEILKRAVMHSLPLPFAAIDNRRSLISIDNLIDFLTLCLTHRNAGNQIFLVSDGLDISTSRLVREMSKSAVVPSKLIYVPIWLLQTVGLITGKQNAVASICNSLQIDSTKAKTLLKWNPPISFVEGIRRAMSDS